MKVTNINTPKTQEDEFIEIQSDTGTAFQRWSVRHMTTLQQVCSARQGGWSPWFDRACVPPAGDGQRHVPVGGGAQAAGPPPGGRLVLLGLQVWRRLSRRRAGGRAEVGAGPG